MGTGCTTCRRGDVENPEPVKKEFKNQKFISPTKTLGLFENPKDFLRSSRETSRQNSCVDQKPKSELNPVTIAAQAIPPDKQNDQNDDSWIGVPKRDNSSESLGKNMVPSCSGILLEFRPKSAYMAEPKQNKPSTEQEPIKNFALKRILTPCSDQQSDTISFGDKARHESEDYIKMSSRVSDTISRQTSKNEENKTISRRAIAFSSNSDNTNTILTYSKSSQGTDIRMSNESPPLPLPSVEPFQSGNLIETKNMQGIIEPPAKESGIGVIKEEGESELVPEKPVEKVDLNYKPPSSRRIVKRDANNIAKMKNTVCKNILKEADKTPIITLLDKNDTNNNNGTKNTNENLNNMSISPIDDKSVYNSFAAAFGI